MALTPLWINKLARRYWPCDGAAALRDQRRRNPGGKPLLSAADFGGVAQAAAPAADDGGLWMGPKVARSIAARRGLVHVHAPRRWETLKKLGWSIQEPHPKNLKSATPEEEEAFKKLADTLAEEASKTYR